jgi:hypothetical protein
MESLEHFDELRDFLLPLRRQNVVGLHVVDVVPRIRHVIGAEDHDLRAI